MRAAPPPRRLRTLSTSCLVGGLIGLGLASCQPPVAGTCQGEGECPRSYTCVQGQCQLRAALDAAALDGAVELDAARRDTAAPADTTAAQDLAPLPDVEAADAGLPPEAGSDATTGDGSTSSGEAGAVDGAQPSDSALPVDSAQPSDAALPADSAQAVDSAPATDAQGPLDSGLSSSEAGIDAGVVASDGGQAGEDASVLPPDDAGVAVDGATTTPDAGPPPACGTVQALRDDFTLANDDVLWWDWADQPDAFLSESGGVLQLDFPATTREAYGGKVSAYIVRLTGGAMRIEVVDGMIAANGSNAAWFRFSLSQQDRVGFHVEGNTLWAQLVVNGTDLDHNLGPYDSTAHRWWQLRESGGQVTFEVSPDGVVWTVLYTMVSPPFSDAGQVQIGGGHYGTVTVADQLRFRNFNASLADPGWCPAASLRDGFDKLSPEWAPGQSTSCSIWASGSSLHIEAQNRSGNCQMLTERLWSLEASSVAVKLQQVPLNAKLTTRIVLHSADGSLWWEWGQRDTQLIAWGETAGQSDWGSTAPVGANTWIRIRRAGTTLYFEAREDQAGVDWTTLLTRQVAADFSAMELGLSLDISSQVQTGASSYEAVFDSFNLD